MNALIKQALFAAAVTAAFISPVIADSITIPGFSFENPLVADGIPSEVASGFSSADAIGWVQAGNDAGIQLATAPPTDYSGMTGSQAAWLNGATTLTSTASLHTITLGDTYTLTVDAAGRDDFASNGFEIELIDDSFTQFATSGTILAANDNTFRPATISYTVAPDSPLINQGLRIRLINNDGSLQTTFDNVRLTVTRAVAAVAVAATITPNAGTPGNYDFTWKSQTGKVYDLVSSPNLATAPATWAVWEGNIGMIANPPLNSLTNVFGGGNTKRFFVVVERDP